MCTFCDHWSLCFSLIHVRLHNCDDERKKIIHRILKSCHGVYCSFYPWIITAALFICSRKDVFPPTGKVMKLKRTFNFSDLYCKSLIRRSHRQRDPSFIIITMETNSDGSWQAVKSSLPCTPNNRIMSFKLLRNNLASDRTPQQPLTSFGHNFISLSPSPFKTWHKMSFCELAKWPAFVYF